MNFVLENLLIVASLFVAMLAFQEWGRRLGVRDQGKEAGKLGSTAAEGSVFALLGLLLAFTFSGAGTRFDFRRSLVVDEANAIGTAWLRLDLLPADRQPEIRDFFRQYLDARIDRYRLASDAAATQGAKARSAALREKIWSSTVAAAQTSGTLPPFTVLIPALNSMFDMMTKQEAASRLHPPIMVFVVLGILTLVGSVFAGYGMAGRKTRSWLHVLGFAGVIALAVHVIVDLEYPRLGLIRIDSADQVLLELRQSMK
jgi:hypothetical protein